MRSPLIHSLIVASALALTAGAALAQTYSKATLNVVGNLGITTQSQQLEVPLWTKVLPAATGGALSGTIKPWNEMGLKGA